MAIKKKTKKTQKGGKNDGYATWSDYTKSKYYTQMKAEGRFKLLEDMRRSYEPGWKAPADINEQNYKPPLSEAGQFIMDNHLISKSVGGLVGMISNRIAPLSGMITGKATELGLKQLGYGKKTKKTQKGKGIIDGIANAILSDKHNR